VATLFIADLHLQTEEPAITAGFLRFYAVKPKAPMRFTFWATCLKPGLATTIPTRCTTTLPPPLRRWLIPGPLLLHPRQP
jgi:hypothetical protein